MSLLIDLASGVIKAVSGARMASRAAGLDTPALEELHDGLSPVRAGYNHARAHELSASADSGQAGQQTDAPGTSDGDLAGTGDGDLAGTGDGFISDVIDWFTDLFS